MEIGRLLEFRKGDEQHQKEKEGGGKVIGVRRKRSWRMERQGLEGTGESGICGSFENVGGSQIK